MSLSSTQTRNLKVRLRLNLVTVKQEQLQINCSQQVREILLENPQTARLIVDKGITAQHARVAAKGVR